MILDHLAQANRPYSAQDVLTNLNGQLGKTEIVNTLDELAAQKKINEKLYGKQKVYMTIQVGSCVVVSFKLNDLLNGAMPRERMSIARL